MLVRAIDVQHDTVKCYAIDAQKQLTCTSKKDIIIGGKKQCYRIDYDSKSCLYSDDQVLRFAEDECLRKVAEWERGDMFVTTAKCGAGFIVDDRCIMPDVIDMNCTDILENTTETTC